MDKQLIISIGREYGSGGHEISRKLAAKLGLKFYDRNLLDEVADSKNVDAENLAKYDETPHKAFFSRTVRGFSNSPSENVAELQFNYLKKKAQEGESFVVVGRCSEEIFKGIAPVISIFVTGYYENKVQRVVTLRNKLPKEAEKTIAKHDKQRRAYHDHFCKGKWGEATCYDLCVNSSVLGIDGTVDFIYDYINRIPKKD